MFHVKHSSSPLAEVLAPSYGGVKAIGEIFCPILWLGGET